MLSNEYPWNHHFISRNWNHSFNPNHSFFLTEGTRTLASVTISWLVCLVLLLSVYPLTLQLVLSAVVHAHLCFASFTFICFWDSLHLQALQCRQPLLFQEIYIQFPQFIFFKALKKKSLSIWLCRCLVVACRFFLHFFRIFHCSAQTFWLWHMGSVVALYGLSYCTVCRVLVPKPGLKPCPLHCKADS